MNRITFIKYCYVNVMLANQLKNIFVAYDNNINYLITIITSDTGIFMVSVYIVKKNKWKKGFARNDILCNTERDQN